MQLNVFPINKQIHLVGEHFKLKIHQPFILTLLTFRSLIETETSTK